MNARYGAWLIIVLGLVLMVGAALVSCAPDTTAPELKESAVTPTVIDEGVAAEPTIETVEFDVEFTDHECLDCHSDEGLLKELAEPPPEEEEESLSSGPG